MFSGLAAHHIGETFPWGTLIVNVTGSFVIGFFATLTGPDGRVFVGSKARQFVMTGICGGYTTFSSFSLQTLKLAHDGEWRSPAAISAVRRGLPRGRLARPYAAAALEPAERSLTMTLPRDAVLLRIFIGEDDKSDGRPLYEAIVLKAREPQLAGATVLRGPMGFGHSSRLHTTKILRLSEDLPLVIEIVDTEDKINAFLPVLDAMMRAGSSHWKRCRCCNTAKASSTRRRDVTPNQRAPDRKAFPGAR